MNYSFVQTDWQPVPVNSLTEQLPNWQLQLSAVADCLKAFPPLHSHLMKPQFGKFASIEEVEGDKELKSDLSK